VTLTGDVFSDETGAPEGQQQQTNVGGSQPGPEGGQQSQNTAGPPQAGGGGPQPGGGMDFLQNIIQMAAGAAMRGQAAQSNCCLLLNSSVI